MEKIKLFRVESVPCTYACNPASSGAYLTRKPALIPDALPAYHGEPVRIAAGRPVLFWVDVPLSNSDAVVTFQAISRKNTIQGSLKLPIHVIPARLPAQAIRHSEWLHCDCLCNAHNCEMFSDRFWDILKNYLLTASSHCIDTLLTPVITPSLDIEPNCSRLSCQLVTIYRNHGRYNYDFSRLRKWVALAQSCGIRYFEIAPFFTQWGAAYAAQIYEETPLGTHALFGWDTPAYSPEYRDFLADFLPALVKELEALQILSETFFHISDEPTQKNLQNYQRAKEMVAPYLQGCKLIDALSDHVFLEQGLVSIPVVAEDQLTPFLADASHREVWTYCCCAQDRLVPNFFLSMPLTRTRILGPLLYRFELRGFLHWGYNFWNSQFSKAAIDPYRITDSDGGFPSGDAFLVYPGTDDRPVSSIRLKTLRDAWVDYQALCLLESLENREAVLSLIQNTLGDISFTEYPVKEEIYQSFYTALCEAITPLL